VIGTKQLFIFGGFDGCKWLNDICVLDIGKMEVNEITTEAIQQLIQNYKKLINLEDNADVCFIVEGKKIFSHKAILQAQCEHF